MIVIHIGAPKAGSSSIQYYLRDNDDALRQLSIDYPLIGREHVVGRFKHGHIAGEVKGSERAARKNRGAIPSLVEHIARLDYATTILSSEAFCLCPDDGIAALHASLMKADPQFRIILIMRNLIDGLPSSFAQRIKFGNRTDDFDSFFNQRTSWKNGTPFKLAERWARVFGWDTIWVRILDPAALIGGDLITDFLASSGLDPNDTHLTALPRPTRINQSPGWRTIEALRAVFGGRSGLAEDHPLVAAGVPKNRLARRDFSALAQEVGREMGWDEERGQYLTTAQATACSNVFAESIQMLNEHLGQKLPDVHALKQQELADRPFLPDVSRIEKAGLEAFYDVWGSRWKAAASLRKAG